jgi:hypothetical protein
LKTSPDGGAGNIWTVTVTGCHSNTMLFINMPQEVETFSTWALTGIIINKLYTAKTTTKTKQTLLLAIIKLSDL